MKFAFIKEHLGHATGWTLKVLCRVIGVTRSGFYAYPKARLRPASKRQLSRQARRKRVAEVFEQHKHRYGAPRIHAQLMNQGITCNAKTAASDTRAMGLMALQNKAFRVTTTDSNHSFPIAPNRLDRDLTASKPNRVWVTDLTYVPTREGWLYLVRITDLFSRKVVGYASANHMRAELCVEALNQAVRRRGVPHDVFKGLIMHSDRGVQYAADLFRGACEGYGILQSMSNKGDCYDNAVAESFFGTLKGEHLDGFNFHTRAEAKPEIFNFIEGDDNAQR
ncbi:MAG: IS3 family transposase, partial [Planctomycetota bacterium]